MRRAGIIAAGTVGAVAIAVGVAWLVVLRDTAEPVAVDEAVTSFRDDTTTVEPETSPIPVGVYVYATAGYEKTDALTGVTHRYPRRSTITVAAADCGVRLTWRVLDGRSTEWTYCTTEDGGWELRSQDERHTFFGRTESTTYVCTSAPIKPATRSSGIRGGRIDCSTDDTREEGLVVVVGAPLVRVGGDRRDTIHVRKTTTFTGANRGTARHDLWFDAASSVPVKLVLVSRTTSDSPIGDVRYEESVTLTLVALEPRR